MDANLAQSQGLARVRSGDGNRVHLVTSTQVENRKGRRMMLQKTINWLADHNFKPWAEIRKFVWHVGRIEARLSRVEMALVAFGLPDFSIHETGNIEEEQEGTKDGSDAKS